MHPSRSRRGWWNAVADVSRMLVKRASPALFAATMGTGAISGLFVAFPYATGSHPMLVFSLIIFFLNLALFILSFVLLAAKYIRYRGKWIALWNNPATSVYVGCFPMGGTTLINVATQVIHSEYNIGGKGFLYFLWAMWWLDICISFLCCWVGLHYMITNQKHSLEAMNATWILPVVTLIVAASCGGVVAGSLVHYSETHALNTVIVSVFMVTVGLCLALMILTIYILRLIIHGLPSGGPLLSVFLPLGPTGQAGYAVLLIGQNLRTLFPPLLGNAGFPLKPDTSAGVIVDVVCTCISFVLWSMATMWILYAFLALHTGLRQALIPFKIPFWGLVFPNAVYANLTIQISNAFDSRAFRVWGAIYAVGTLLLWISIFSRSLWELKTFLIIRKNADSNLEDKDDVQQEIHTHGSTHTSSTEIV
ncbi:hypothetical protein D9613_000669 [Agrocybe pediades]|uniref:Voltage-dependent anion channel n=1 Tax=Agrocybe pediades TaxID=84607 RepID=A0A8H4R0E6_9AGAR|nr:hypothetical protein D9613_000669 [Agrocybe pediades]KAF9566787.1 hypothetical protein CPC08DRAFT_703751 [Agrocybe pediades]